MRNHRALTLLILATACKGTEAEVSRTGPEIIAKAPAHTAPEVALDTRPRAAVDDREEARRQDKELAAQEDPVASREVAEAEAALATVANGTFDFSTVDPSSAIGFVDLTTNPIVERARCGGIEKDVAPLQAVLARSLKQGEVIDCRRPEPHRIRCAVVTGHPSFPGGAGTESLIFDWEVHADSEVTGPMLRAVAKEVARGTPAERGAMFDRRDALLAKLAAQRCRDTHGQ